MKLRSLLTIKLIHTLIWMIMVAAICYVLWSGITGDITIWSWVAVGLVVAEGGILLIFRGYCPLTVLARKYSNSNSANFDIFLPNWLARYNKQIFTTIFLVGLVLMLLHYRFRYSSL